MNALGRQTVAQVCLCLMLPGFFFYHSMVGVQLLPPVLGGYSTAMAMALLLPLSVVFLQHLLASPSNRLPVDTAFFCFMVFYGSVLIIQGAIGTRSHAVSEQFGILFQFACLYMAARLVPVEDRRLHRWMLVFLLAMTGLIIANADDGTFVIVALELRELDTKLANYQAYAFVYSVTMLYVLAGTTARYQRLLLYLICIPTLFLNGARTELIGTFALALCLEFLEARHKWLTVVVAAAIVGIVIACLPLLADLFPESRTVLLFLDASGDISANERAEMFRDGWQNIQDHPFLGNFQHHRIGEHIHNALSAWIDLGLVGFLAYAGLLAVPAVHLFFLQRRDFSDPNYLLAFAMSFQMVLYAITAKHYTHQLFPLALGVYSRHLLLQRRKAQQPSAPTQTVGPATGAALTPQLSPN